MNLRYICTIGGGYNQNNLFPAVIEIEAYIRVPILTDASSLMGEKFFDGSLGAMDAPYPWNEDGLYLNACLTYLLA